MSPQKWGSCLKGSNISPTFQFENETINELKFSAKIIVAQKISSSDLQFTVSAVRCSMDMKNCLRFAVMPTMFNLCELFEEKDKFYTVIFDAAKPRLKCPIESGNYTLDKITMDMTPLDFLPIDGNIWLLTFRILEDKSKKVHMCLNTQSKIVRRRLRN